MNSVQIQADSQAKILAFGDRVTASRPQTMTASNPLTDVFDAIDLDQLNTKAEMLERLDNKYVLQKDVFERAASRFAEHFDVLEIAGVRDFAYETCYFDDAARSSYFDHQGKRRRRWKVRTRYYVEAKLCYVEIKLKDKRGMTVKKRLRCAPEEHGSLSEAALAHIRSAYADLYGEAFTADLAPVIRMRYQRMTLVAKQGGERMTIDHGLKFRTMGASGAIDPEVFIVETKSTNANGLADKILRGLHQHPTKHCSKYCAGMAAAREVTRCNRFLPALRKLGVTPLLQAA